MYCAESIMFNTARGSYTQNELNNIIYLCIKYTFGKSVDQFRKPNNSDIKDLMLEIGDDCSAGNIIEVIMAFINRTINEQLKYNKDVYMQHMEYIISKFNSQPYDLRNDLGKDKDTEEFVTKH